MRGSGATYAVGFKVGSTTLGDFTHTAGVWTNGVRTFDPSTGLPTAVPEPGADGSVGAPALTAIACLRRRRMKVSTAL